MIEFISQYWLEFVFGLVAACIIFIIKQYYASKQKIEDKEQDEFKEEILKTINKDIQEQVAQSRSIDEGIQATIKELEQSVSTLNQSVLGIQNTMIADNVQALKQGVLSMQGKVFKGDCRRLLEPAHIITEEEYEDIVADHKSYNGLGGNHLGDGLFKSVMNKWDTQVELSLKEKYDESKHN